MHTKISFNVPKMAEATTKHAVVTGANKGIGYEIVRQLASNEAIVVLTARDEKRGLEAVEKLKQSGYGTVIFHQLDVTDPASIHSLVHFIKCQFGKLDILVNNAGISGVSLDGDDLSGTVKVKNAGTGGVILEGDNFSGVVKDGVPIKWYEMATQTYELTEKCLQTNFYGTKRVCEALIPLLQLSASPRIVNVSSSWGKLKYVTNEWAKGVLSDVENLTEERVDEVLREYQNDFKQGSLETKGWPGSMSAYVVSKVAINAYTRIMAKKFPNVHIYSSCPGYVKTDINYNNGTLTTEEGAESPVWLALLPNAGPSGLFFSQKEETSFD